MPAQLVEPDPLITDADNGVGQENALGQAQTFDFDGSFNRDFVQDSNGNPTQYVRTPMGLTTAITDALGQSTYFTYDPATNNLEPSTDARNNTTIYTYDAQNNLRSVTNALGHTTVYTYNAVGQVIETTDENGNTTRYGYDSLGNRTVITDALGYATYYEIDDLGRVITTTDAKGKVTINEYDPADQVIKITENYLPGQLQNYQDEYNLITTYNYDGAGRRLTTTDTLGRVNRNIYDAAGRLIQTIQNEHPTVSTQNYQDEYNLITEYGYDELGRQVAITDTLGYVNRTIYDAAGRVERTVTNYIDRLYNPAQPDQDFITQYEYDANGNVVKTIELPGSAEERATCTVYDELNRLERTLENCVTADPANPATYSSAPDEDLATVYTYDEVGNQIQITNPKSQITNYDYDSLNRVITITNAIGGQTIYDYDPAGNRTQVKNPKSQITNYEYDALNRVVTTTNALNGQTIVRYDEIGNRTHTIDALGRVTTYTYDSLYRLRQIENPKSEIVNYTYDALGNRRTVTDAEGTVTHSQYDTLNRLTVTTLNYVDGGPSDSDTNVQTNVTYDALGRRTQITNAKSQITEYGYDGLGRTVAITDALDHVTTFTYDGLGNRRAVTNAEQETTEFEYDGLNRLQLTRDPEGNETEYQYDKAGNRVTMIDPSTGSGQAPGIETRYQYDPLNRLERVIENYIPGGPSNAETNVATEYKYDPVGNRTKVIDARQNPTTYVYDDLNRLSQVIDPLGQTTEYGYDAVGNRTVITDANTLAGTGGVVTTFDYDRVNRLTDIDYSDATPDVSFTYDQVGNRTRMDDGVGSTGFTEYAYDDLYRLTDVTDGADQHVGYAYDAVGNRTNLTYPDNRTVTYNYDAVNRLDTVTTDWLTGQFDYTYDDANRLDTLTLPNNVTSDYTYDAAGRLTLLTHSDLVGPLASYEYALDGVGNRTVLTETLDAVLEVGGPYLESGGLVTIEAEGFSQISQGSQHDWLLRSSQNGYTGTGYLQNWPDIDTLYEPADLAASPVVSYPINFSTPGTYLIWVRAYAESAASDSLYVSLDGDPTTVTGFDPVVWDWANEVTPNGAAAQVVVSTSGLHTLSLWVREDGLQVDRLLLTTDTNYVPTGFGPAETARQPGTTTIPLPVDRVIEYDYDPLYRLTGADYSTGELYEYDYDPVSNRLQQIIAGNTTSYLYDDANRLAQVDGQSYNFDANGNLLETGTMTNTWDAANRLVEVDSSFIPQPSSFHYNGVGDRVGQTEGGITTDFALDVVGLPEVIQTSDGNSYLHLPGVIVAESAGGEVRYLLSDGLGSVRQAVDETGVVVASYEFDPYGNPVQNGGERYGYTGEWWQDEIGLLHLRARWYAPETGTFLSRDPVESEPPYLYVGGNVVNRVDPSGKVPTLEGIEEGRFSFSCRCGWIDWGHASPRAARELMTAVRAQVDGGDPTYKGVRASQGGRFGGVSDIAVVLKNITRDYQTAAALGIFMETSEAFEEYQGLFGAKIGNFRLGAEISYYSIEDLPSNLIGFYSMLQSEDYPNGLTEKEQKDLIKPLCGALEKDEEDKAWSREVFLAYRDSGLLYEKNFEWHPGFFVVGGVIDSGVPFDKGSSCIIVGGCRGKDRRWPSELSNLEKIAMRSHERIAWFWPWQDTEEEAFVETSTPGAYEYYRK